MPKFAVSRGLSARTWKPWYEESRLRISPPPFEPSFSTTRGQQSRNFNLSSTDGRRNDFFSAWDFQRIGSVLS